MNKIRAFFKKYGVIIFSVFLIAVYSCASLYRYQQNDTFSAIANGNYILEHGLDDKDHFTFHEDLTYVKYRWGFDVIAALIYNHAGFFGIHLAVIAMTTIIGTVIFVFGYKKTGCASLPLAAALVIIAMNLDYLCMRAQIISYLIFLLEIIFMYQYRDTKNARYLCFLPIFSMLILTFHATVWLAFIAFMLPFIVNAFLRREDRKAYLIAFLASFAAILISPLGFAPLTYIFRILGDTVSSDLIIELQPPNPMLLLFFVAPAILAVVSAIMKRRHSIIHIMYCVGLTFFAALALRNIAVAYICIIPATLIAFAEIKKVIASNKKVAHVVYNITFFAPIIFLAIGVLAFYKAYSERNWFFVDYAGYPVGAADYIVENIDLGTFRTYNDFNDGAYLDFRGIPTFIDSRSEVFEKNFNDIEAFADFRIFNQYGQHSYANDLIEKYSLTHFLTYNIDPMSKYLHEDFDRVEVEYQDAYFTLFKVKN